MRVIAFMCGLLVASLFPKAVLSETEVFFCSSFEAVDVDFLEQIALVSYSRKSERLIFRDLRSAELGVAEERTYFLIIENGAIDALGTCLSYIGEETSHPRVGIVNQMVSLGQPSNTNDLIPFLPSLGGVLSSWATFDVPGGVIVSLVSVDDLELVEIDLEIEFRDSEYLPRTPLEAN